MGAGADVRAAEPGETGRTKPAAASPGRRNIIPLAEIKVGMEGYGLTTFEGTKPDKFHVKVIGFQRKIFPKQDFVVVESQDPRLKHTGIVGGMSGSPVYFGGRLAGAISLGMVYGKDPLMMFTPIEYMLAVNDRPLRGPDRTAVAQEDTAVSRQLLAQTMGLTPEGWPAPAAAAAPPAPAGIQRVAVPMMVSGFSPRAVEELRKAFAPFGLEPLQLGGGGAEPGGPTKFEPGGAIGITLVRGDWSIANLCTVTYVEANRVLACGHPIFQAGEMYLPVSNARVITHIASIYRSAKMFTPLAEAGSMVMDRQAAIVADTSQRADMIPIEVTVGGVNLPSRTLRAEVVKHKFLTPMLASAVVMSAAHEAAPDFAHAVIGVRATLKVRGFEPLTFADRVYSPDGLQPRVLAFSGAFRAMQEIIFNPFEPAHLEKLSFQVDVSYRADVAEMVGLRVDALEVEPEKRVNLYVTMRPYAGAEYVETVPFDVPRDYAGQTLSVEVTPGPFARPPVPAPENLRGIVENLRKLPYPGDAYVITITRPGEGLSYRGRLMPELPPSEIDTLRQSTALRRVDSYRAVTQIVRHAGRIVVGRQGITFKVKDLP
jgi:hypothetical protein